MTIQMYLCLAIFLFLILGYVFSKQLHVTLGTVAMCAIVLTAFSGIIPAKTVLSNFSNSNVILIISMFIVAAGFNKTQAVHNLSQLVYKISGGSFTVMLAGYCIIAFMLAQLIPSPVVVFTVVSPLLAASCEAMGISPSKAMFSLGLIGVGSTGVLPLGSGAVAFAQQNGYLESYGYTDYSMSLLDPFFGRFPIAVVIFLYAIFLAPKIAPAQPTVPITLTTSAQAKKDGKTIAPLDSLHEVLGYLIFALTTIALIFSSKLGISGWQIAFTGATLAVVTGVLSPKEATNAIPLRIALMQIAAYAVGGAMTECGLGVLIGDVFASVIGRSTNGYVIGAAFFLVPFILTQAMNNTSVINIFTPILILTCKSLGCNPIGPLLLLMTAALTAFMTPMATGTIAPMMGAGGYDQADLFKMGWLPSIIISVFAIFYIMTVFPAF